jgi:hypothetical protein
LGKITIWANRAWAQGFFRRRRTILRAVNDLLGLGGGFVDKWRRRVARRAAAG